MGTRSYGGCSIAGHKSRTDTTDGHKAYLEAVEGAFGMDCDFAVLIEQGECIGTETKVVMGNPDPRHISTSYVERQNLSVRMSMHRFTRLTTAFSKQLENHEHMLATYFIYYNFRLIHQTLRVTPAMEAGLSGHIWTIEELVALLEPKSILGRIGRIA